MSGNKSFAIYISRSIPAAFVFLVLFAATAFSRDVTFTWNANEESVDGYKLYYKAGSSGPPYNGTGAAEGGSPINTGNVTSYTLHGLSDTQTYYFVLTAYLGAEESGYSNELVLSPAPANTPPTASNANISVTEDTQYSGQLGANDPDGDSLTFILVSTAGKGSVSLTNSATGAFTYTPSPNINGSDSFTFKVNDGKADSPTATVSVNIAAVNDPPTATGTSISTTTNTPVSRQLSGSDPDGDPLTFSIVTNGVKGTASINNSATGAFTYVPNENAEGGDSFSFRVNDGSLNSSTATVNVTIIFVNTPPTATATAISTDANTDYTGQLSGSDADGDALTFSIVTNGTKGNAVITNASNGNFTYTPDTDESGNDTFTFRVNDGTENSTTATVAVVIKPVNTPPVAADTSITLEFNTEATGQLPAYDRDEDTLTYSIITNGAKGSAVITDAATGVFRYTPAGDAIGDDSFTFMVNDGQEDSGLGTVTVTILDGSTQTAVFGDSSGSDYPGTLQDTYTNVNTTNYSTVDVLKTYSVQKASNTIVMKVDLSALPTYATIIEAKAVLYQSAASGEAQYLNTLHKIIGKDPVIPEVTGYNAAADGQTWAPVPPATTFRDVPLGVADIGAKEDEQLLFTQPAYRSWRITQMVQEWVATPSTNYGLLIMGEETATEAGRTFASSENDNPDVRPQVVVRYKLIPRPPRLISIEEIK
jgi:VCBS repeat-containing protein